MKPRDRGPVVVRPPGSTVPIPIGRDTDISREAEECLETVVRDAYDGDCLDFLGKSRLEATILSLAQDAPHDPDARKELLDRVMGKPKQRIDSTQVSVDLTSFLLNLPPPGDEEEVVENGEFSVREADSAEGESSLLC